LLFEEKKKKVVFLGKKKRKKEKEVWCHFNGGKVEHKMIEKLKIMRPNLQKKIVYYITFSYPV
jgi:hypothetical protein